MNIQHTDVGKGSLVVANHHSWTLLMSPYNTMPECYLPSAAFLFHYYGSIYFESLFLINKQFF